MPQEYALDTSVALPYLLESHPHHAMVRQALSTSRLRLTGHSLAETYSVLTRLPGDARIEPGQASSLLERAFDPPVLIPPETTARLPAVLSELGIGGGAVYDGLVGLAAQEADLVLVTHDGRARNTYLALGMQFKMLW